jgi:hypothetical protein
MLNTESVGIIRHKTPLDGGIRYGTGGGSVTTEIARCEIIDDVTPESLTHIQDMVLNAQLRGSLRGTPQELLIAYHIQSKGYNIITPLS